jgi:ubiquinone/menaquinone biosynthesis C-methylase UbiE
MKWLTKHIGLTTSVGEFQFKRWVDNHASEVIADIGVKVGKAVLDFGCGSGICTISAAKLVGADGRVYALDVSTESLDRIEKMAKQEGLENIFRIDAPPEVSVALEDETIDIMLMIDVLQDF